MLQDRILSFLKIQELLKVMFVLMVGIPSRTIPTLNVNKIDASLWVYISDQGSSELYYPRNIHKYKI